MKKPKPKGGLEKALEKKRGARGPKGALEKALEKKRGVPKGGD